MSCTRSSRTAAVCVNIFRFGAGGSGWCVGVQKVSPVINARSPLVKGASTFVKNHAISDGGRSSNGYSGLKLNDDGYAEAMKDSIAAKYIIEIVGVRNANHMLWLKHATDDIARSEVLSRRIEHVKTERIRKSISHIPSHLPASYIQLGDVFDGKQSCVTVPAMSTSGGRFHPIRVTGAVPGGDISFDCSDADFAAVGSRHFYLWCQYADTGKWGVPRWHMFKWNTFPVPMSVREAAAEAALAGDWELVDKLVDERLGCESNDEARLKRMREMYVTLTADEQKDGLR